MVLGGRMKIYDTRIFITSDISEGFVISGRYNRKTEKINWYDYSKNMNVLQEERIISKILSYGVLSSPLIIVPLIALLSDKNSSLTIEKMLGGRISFWILTIIFGFLVTNSILYRIGKHQFYGEEIPELGIIVEKNVITCQIDRGLRRYRTDDNSLSSSGAKIPSLSLLFIILILVGFTGASYYASNDSTAGFGGQLLFYTILVILIATLISLVQLAIPVYHGLLKLEKNIDLKVKQLNAEKLQEEINRAEQFYKNHQVSNAAIKRYLAEYKKILKEKEMEIKK